MSGFKKCDGVKITFNRKVPATIAAAIVAGTA
jgi:hypothetical protein